MTDRPDAAEREAYFELVRNDFFTLRIEWRLYRSLFGTNPETVDLLNAVSGPTASTLERVLFERCLLGLRRLTDNPKGYRGRSSSVTIKGLVERFGSDDQDLKRLVATAVKKSTFARDWSSKKIAHADLDYRQGRAQLEKASRAKVETAMDSISAVLKWISATHFDTLLDTHPIPPWNDEREFLRALYLGQNANREYEEQHARLLEERRYRELGALEKRFNRFPAWLYREDPPIDTD